MPNHVYRRDLMGEAKLSDYSDVVAGDWGTYELVYTAGTFGIDDMGGVRVAFRTVSDMTALQTTDPTAPGYVTVEASNGAPLEIDFSARRHYRPWGKCLQVRCLQFLSPGDTLTFRFGDQRKGSPGVRMQTNCEEKFSFRVTVDPYAASDFIALPEDKQQSIKIVPGAPALWKAQLPTLRNVGDEFRLIVKCEDKWGNPTDQFSGSVELKASSAISGLPETVSVAPSDFASVINGLSVTEPGTYRVDVLVDGKKVATSNPLRIQTASPFGHYWADMHGQSGETIGTGSIREYMDFAKYRSFLDISGHQGNDFQIDDAFWAEINELSAEYEEEGKFIFLPGYEWSGNTGMGGDHNVWYRHEGQPIYRSSRALINETTFPETDCHDLSDLYKAMENHEAIVVPHVGGRFADVSHGHDPRVEHSVEVHSSWGTFDWIVHDSMKLGYRIGIVGASDGHKCRPGASYPGDGKFGSYGGLTCHLLPELTRDCLFDQFARRHHYATTGSRLFMAAEAHFQNEAQIYDRAPGIGDETTFGATKAIMGDIVKTQDTQFDFTLDLSTQSPVERIDLYNGTTLSETYRPYEAADLGRRIRVICKGQKTRGRQRLVSWNGEASVEGAKITRIAPCNYYHPEKLPKQISDTVVTWDGVTTGGFTAVDIWLDDVTEDAVLKVKTNHADLETKIHEIGLDGETVECGGLDITLGVTRLPEEMSETEVSLTRSFDVQPTGDTAVYARVTTEDGHVAWSSPIYVFREES